MSIFNKKPLTRDDIFDIQDIEIESLDVPEWGGMLYVKGMTGTERDRFEASIIDKPGKNARVKMDNIRAKLCAETICDEQGVKLFTPGDIKKLGEKSAAALQRVFDVAQRLSGITEEDIDELAEDMEANPSDGSASD